VVGAVIDMSNRVVVSFTPTFSGRAVGDYGTRSAVKLSLLLNYSLNDNTYPLILNLMVEEYSVKSCKESQPQRTRG